MKRKYITYPRTDSRFLTEDMENGIPVLAKATAGFFMPQTGELPVNTAQVIDSSKVSDHHAIIPTLNCKGLDVQSLPMGERETLLLLAIRLLVAVGDTLLSSIENANKAEIDAERKGIGTPATRAGILEKLIKTGFAERKGDKKVKYFTATHKGTALITVLPEQVQSPLMTAEWEEKLKLVERGQMPSLRQCCHRKQKRLLLL